MGPRFEGKVALITGGASGIGRATAERLAAEGARVMIGDLDGERAASVARAIGAAAVARAVDVAEYPQVAALVEHTVATFGRLDVLFNNAGIGTAGRAPEIAVEEWKRVLAVDVDSIFFGCKAAIPHMAAQGGGAIVNTASISGLHGDYGLGPYNAAKGAVVNYTRTLALDHAREHIRVNAVCPGPIETPLAAPFIEHPEIGREYARRIPMGRPGRADEVAAAVAFLASDDAAYVTGAMLVVDGGLTAHTGQPIFTDYF